jgi:indolepyruvate ferredoxin oxidoreductase beta subunit
MEKVKNILLAGVGGQGIILASKILSDGLISAGYDVKMSEVHGMAQRGGSVTPQVRYGEKVYSPIIGKGQADILVSFELMETSRWIEYLKMDGKVVINDYKIPSAPILIGKNDYPDHVIEHLKEKTSTTIINAFNIAKEIGNVRTMNVVIVGALVKAMGLDEIDWESVIRSNVKESFGDINVRAFNMGLSMVH